MRSLNKVKPIVIAHRGASGLRPEHTLEGYALAIRQGADFIEPDLVLTRDGVFVARHENEISGTTDVADHPEYADRRTARTIDGAEIVGWFTEDFTLAELKTLRAKERIPQLRPDNVAFDGRYAIPTLDEIVALAKAHNVGIYPETKHPSYFAAIGLPMEALLVAQLRGHGWDSAESPVILQSFEVDNLKALHGMTGLRLIQLIERDGAPADRATASYAAMTALAGLAEIATYAWGIGPNKALVQDGDAAPTTLVADAHAAGLCVHPWTFRRENAFLPASLRKGDEPSGHGLLADEIARYLALGIDGFFTDFPMIGAAARDAHDKE